MFGNGRLWMMTLAAVCALAASAAAQSAVMMSLRPDIRRISLDTGPKKLMIEALAGGEGLTFDWRLEGPGRLVGDKGSADIDYIPPDHLNAATETVSVRLSIRSRDGQTGQGRIDLILVDPTPGGADRVAPPDREAPEDREPTLEAGKKAVEKKEKEAGKDRIVETLSLGQLFKLAAEREKRERFAAPEGKSALTAYREILRQAPAHPGVRRKIGQLLRTVKTAGDRAMERSDYTRARSMYEQYLAAAPLAERVGENPLIGIERREVADRLKAVESFSRVRRLEALRPGFEKEFESYRALLERENRGQDVMGPIISRLRVLVSDLAEIESIYRHLAEDEPAVSEKADRVAEMRDQLENELDIRRSRGFDGDADGVEEATQ